MLVERLEPTSRSSQQRHIVAFFVVYFVGDKCQGYTAVSCRSLSATDEFGRRGTAIYISPRGR